MLGPWKELLRLAYEAATESPDPSTQNGGVVFDYITGVDGNICRYDVVARDFNRFPRGVRSTPERWNNRALKYPMVHHAEASALGTARRARHIPHLNGYGLACPWAACSGCAKEIIDEGITLLVTHKQAHDRGREAEERAVREGKSDRMVWTNDIAIAFEMMREAKIEIVEFDGVVDGPPVLHGGVIWHP